MNEAKERIKDRVDEELYKVQALHQESPQLAGELAKTLIRLECIIVCVGYPEARGTANYGQLVCDYFITDATEAQLNSKQD